MDGFWPTVITIANVIGLPAVITWALYDRRRVRNEARQGELVGDEQEATLPNRIRSSSVVTLEAEILALQNTFNADRQIKDHTIQWLKEQLEEEREENRKKDRLIDELQDKVRDLTRRVAALVNDLDRVQQDLDRFKAQSKE